MKRFLSYIWPITKYIDSSKNGRIEVTWIDGKKVLNTKNANFSYGTSQKILKYGLSKIEVHQTSEILLLGLGAGSVVKTLRKNFKHTGKIKALEIDKVIIDVAQKEFNLMNDDALEIICGDAFEYIKNTEKTYDIVIVDIFIDRNLPDECYTSEFWNNLSKITKTKGFIVFNAGFYQLDNKKLADTLRNFEAVFDFSKYDKIQGNSTVLVAKKV